MKDVFRHLAYHFGIFGLIHRIRNREALTVLMFHRVLPDSDVAFVMAEREYTMSLTGFRRVLDFVEKHYQVVRLEDVKRWAQGEEKLPPCPVLITFDDGWLDTLTRAAPELQKRRLSAVLFVASEVPLLLSPRWWQDVLVEAMADDEERGRLLAAAGFTNGLVPPEDAAWRVAAQLAAWTEAERFAWLKQHAPIAARASCGRQMLNALELVQLNSVGLEFAGHGHTHAPLTLVASPTSELQASYRMVKQFQDGPAAMSFPHGAWSPTLLEQARNAGFELVFNSSPKLARRTSGASVAPEPIGRIHLPENEWTTRHGIIDFPRLASFLFLR